MKINRLTILSAILLVTSAANAQVPAPIRNAMDYRGIPDDAVSIYIEDVATGDVVLAINEQVPRNPASVEKMLTTLAALDRLGPSYRWKTEVTLLGEVRDGTLHGDLQLKGFGDPYLVTERFWLLLRQIRQLGIERIDGDILIDDSFFDIGDYDPAAFDREPLRAYNVAPNAMLTNFKVSRFFFTPEEGTNRVTVQMDPMLANLEIDNRLRTVNGACRGYQRGIAMHPENNYQRIVLSGRFPSGCEIYAMDRSTLNHNAFTFGLFESLWRELGGEISGGFRNADADPTLEPDLVFDSPSLAEVISRVNKYSNNVMSRHLLYTLSAETYGAPGTETGGRKAIEEWLVDKGFEFPELVVDNGAGLSRKSRISAEHLAELLRYAWESPYMPEYLSSLSLSGHDGTLSRRFRDQRLDGTSHMKTGSLDHVSGIGGFFQSQRGARYVVVQLINHTDVHRGTGKEVQEMMLRWLYER